MASYPEGPDGSPRDHLGRRICISSMFARTDDTDDEQEESHLHPLPRWVYASSLRGSVSTDHRIGTGRVLPERFVPPDEDVMPQALFQIGTSFRATPPTRRFLSRTNSRQLLIYTGGACLDTGTRNARAGCSIIYRDSTLIPRASSYARFPLEKKGPTAEPHPQSSNRAELRAAIAGLRFRFWVGEGFTSLVLATDSEYVVEGITRRVKEWVRNDWKTSAGVVVKHKDLWQCLLGEIERWDEQEMQVWFWRIPREWNLEANRHAQKAANEERRDEFMDICGVFV